ncbi:hypothetical protein R3P38DRAFT_3201233 [Favolaschia claudopus]|uniref:Uncharacterized protein n=1 Tax=Favolaschia claudopus TaxID=2862362 RepID=A0AAW0AW30_9AGAR
MKYASRKYVDLILQVSSKWASWDPPHLIEVGDYGTIDKETGLFQKDGNIYTDPATAKLCADYQPDTRAPDEVMVVCSQTEKKRDFGLGPEIDIPGIAEASIKGQWKFKSGKTGALLVMAQPRSSIISGGALFSKLIDTPSLKDKYLVTETVACHAYSLYLSSKMDDVISLALVAKTPLPVSPLVSAGGEISATWWSQTGSGVFRHGCAERGTYSFTPLFALKRLRKISFVRYRGEPTPEERAEDMWDSEPESPWGPLDEDGEEDVFEDRVHD